MQPSLYCFVGDVIEAATRKVILGGRGGREGAGRGKRKLWGGEAAGSRAEGHAFLRGKPLLISWGALLSCLQVFPSWGDS